MRKGFLPHTERKLIIMDDLQDKGGTILILQLYYRLNWMKSRISLSITP